MKHIIFLGDGMADEPLDAYGGRTPIEAAKTPNLDRIAREGRTGLFKSLTPGLPAGSDSANLAVMGYNVSECLQGRGVLEAASMGVEIGDHQIAMRLNLICLEGDRIKNHSAGHITTEEAKELLEALDNATGATDLHMHPGVSYRHLLVADEMSPEIECAPPHDYPGEPWRDHLILPKSPEGAHTAKRLNDFIQASQGILRHHSVNRRRMEQGMDPANSVWPWSPGRRPKMWTYPERFGVEGAVISAVDLVKGIGVYAGLEPIAVEGATGLYDTNYEGKADACLKALETKDFVYLHVEAPDEAGHEGDAELKIKTIEDFDARCVGRVLAGLEERGIEAVCAVLPDHPTPVAKRIHTRDPIPFAILDPRQAPDAVQAYSERDCAKGALGVIEGDAFIKLLFG